MHRLCVLLVIPTILLAGAVNIRNVTLHEGSSYSVSVNSAGHEVIHCKLETPLNGIISFKPGDESQTTEKFQIDIGTGMSICALTIRNIHKDDEGLWRLTYDHDGNGDARNETFNLIVNAAESSSPVTTSLGDAINIAEGTDLYLSLPNTMYIHDPCKLYGPNDKEITDFEDDRHQDVACGYIVRNINRTQNGTWAIVYERQKVTHRATVEVNVLELVEISAKDLEWTVGSAIDEIVGPEDAIYCSVADSKGNPVFDGFGPCKVVMDRVTLDHEGRWKFAVGMAGTVIPQHSWFSVKVQASDSKPVVRTNLTWDDLTTHLTCSVPIEYEVQGQACQFRHPNGSIFIASRGVGQEQYTGAIAGYESDTHNHECTLRLLEETWRDQGIWRCAMNTTRGISYGFIILNDDYGDHYWCVEPVLKGDAVDSLAGDAATMRCSIGAAIRYCYFRSSNGTVFNVGPSTSSAGYKYVGNGFDAGECGIRFESLSTSDEGTWSCHVGLNDTTAAEQRYSFSVSVLEHMKITQFWLYSSIEVRFNIASREGFYYGPKLEYCRFVRIDGLGFTSENVPSGYMVDTYDMERGQCGLTIYHPTILDMYPWTMVAKVAGVAGEVSMISDSMVVNGMSTSSVIIVWVLCTTGIVMLILAALSLIPKKNRQWTYERAAHIRNSFRRRPATSQTTPSQTAQHIITDLPPKA